MLMFSYSASAQSNSLTLTDKGVGKFKFGVKATKIPKEVKGFYSSYNLEEVSAEKATDGEEAVVTFFKNVDRVGSMKIYDLKNGVIDNLTIYTLIIKSESGFKTTDNPSVLLDKSIEYDENYNLIVDGYGITLKNMPDSYNEKLEKAKAEGSKMTLTQDDIAEDSAIAAISMSI